MTWGGSTLREPERRYMPLSRKVSLTLLGAGLILSVFVSLGFWEDEEQRLRSTLSGRAEAVANLIKEGARTAENREQLLHFLKALETQTDLFLIRLVRMPSYEIVVEYRSEQHATDDLPKSGNATKLLPPFPSTTSAPDTGWLREAHEFRYTCPILFRQGGADSMSPSKGLLTLHVSSAAVEAEARAIKQTTALRVWGGFTAAALAGLGCFWCFVGKPLKEVVKRVRERISEGSLGIQWESTRDEIDLVRQGLEDSFQTTLQLRQQLSAKNQQLSKFLDQANWLTEAALSGNRTKVEFLATMSHEIRTPLNGIVGFTTLLLETAQTREQKEFTSMVQDSARTLLKLIDTLLDLSKIQAGKMKLESAPFGIQACVSDAVASVAGQAREKGLELKLEIDSTLPASMLGDKYRIRQVILNLLGNAVKFTKSGQVTVEVKRRGLGPKSPGEKPAEQLLLRVIDTGPGIPPEKRTTLFQKFQQLDAAMSRRHGGSGLGLVMSKSFVDLMGGEIGMSSELGQGSTFWFVIPLLTADDSNAAPTDTPLVTPPSSYLQPAQGDQRCQEPMRNAPNATGLRALVADDNRMNRRLAQRLLEKLGFQIDEAQNGREAVDLVKSNSYALVLMDWQMPEMDGAQATREIRQWEEAQIQRSRSSIRKRLPIVAVTANAMPGDRETCLLSGMDGYIAKPLREGDLRQEIQRHLSP